MGTITMIAAPYSYGPTAKLLCVADDLAVNHNLFFVGSEPSLSLARFGPFEKILPIMNRDDWDAAALRELRRSDLLVSFLDYRALRLADSNGLKYIFVDTLHWLRDTPPPFSDIAAEYIAQTFFASPKSAAINSLPRLRAVGPILPKLFDQVRSSSQNRSLNSIVVNFGGLRSPAMREGADITYVAWILDILRLLGIAQTRLSICLPLYLRDYASTLQSTVPTSRFLFPTANEFHNLLTLADLLITVPGLEVVLEAMCLGVPVIFLPPYNGTQCMQLHQYRQSNVGILDIAPSMELPAHTDLTVLTRLVQTDISRYSQMTDLTSELAARLGYSLQHIVDSPHVLEEHRRQNDRLLSSLGSNGRKCTVDIINSSMHPH